MDYTGLLVRGKGLYWLGKQITNRGEGQVGGWGGPVRGEGRLKVRGMDRLEGKEQKGKLEGRTSGRR